MRRAARAVSIPGRAESPEKDAPQPTGAASPGAQ